MWIFLILIVVLRFLSLENFYKDGQKLRITTRVFTDPAKFANSQTISLKGIKIILPKYPEINYGDKIIVEGDIFKKEIRNGKIIKKEESHGVFPVLRKKIISFYQSVLPQPHSSLVSGIVLGAKSDLPAGFWEALKKTSTAHVVVASGMNVTLVASFLISALALVFPRKWGIVFALVGILGYVFLSGLEAPIVRAAIMGSIAFVAQEAGRVASALRVLVLTALLMLIAWPEWLGDIGFILSFAATLSLIVFQKKIRDLLERRKTFLPEFAKADFATTLSAQIGVTPILIVAFGQFNIISPLINALVLWTIPFIMVIGALGGAVGIPIPGLGRLILYFLYPLTWWFISIVELFG